MNNPLTPVEALRREIDALKLRHGNIRSISLLRAALEFAKAYAKLEDSDYAAAELIEAEQKAFARLIERLKQ